MTQSSVVVRVLRLVSRPLHLREASDQGSSNKVGVVEFAVVLMGPPHVLEHVWTPPTTYLWLTL